MNDSSGKEVRKNKKISWEVYSTQLSIQICANFRRRWAKSVGEEVNSLEGKLWKDAMLEEIELLYKNETWDLVKLPNGTNIVGSKWVFRKKMNFVGQVDKFKARLVSYSQVKGVNVGDIFSLLKK